MIKLWIFAADLDLQQIQLPHVRMPSRKHGGPAKHHTPATPEEYFRVQFFSAIDMATTQLHERFDQVSLGNLVKLEELLITGNKNMKTNKQNTFFKSSVSKISL